MDWGQAAPGPVELMLPPDPTILSKKNYTEFHSFGIERQRAIHLISAARSVRRLDAIVDLDSVEASRLLQSVPGIGPWTAGYVLATTLGDADAIILGDDNLPSSVAWVIAGEPRASDERMLELLKPYAGHRWRVCRMIIAAGHHAPRYGHRQRIIDIRRM